MFSKVLVANRGEIAVRVQQTLKTLGIATVAVYSDPDSAAPHVSMADEAWPLGGQTAGETYLDIDKLIAIARRCGADAIHTGYGFLSENPRFARVCGEAGITFIGPTPENMEALGDKISSKALAQRAGALVVPNSPPCTRIDTAAEEFVAIWGFPLLVKAAAGGGGRGMRLVSELEELAPVAPVEAVVEDTHFLPGAWVPAGRPVLSLLPDDKRKLRFFVPDADVARMKVGRVMGFRCDGCDGKLSARVTYIAPKAEYTPPVIYSAASRAKLVFLIEALPEGGTVLPVGLPVEVGRGE